MDDQQFRQLLDYFGYSWKGYRKVRRGVKKRIVKHMQETGCRTVNAYLRALARDGELRHQCESVMCVSISRFFRDRLLWELIEDQLIPEFIEKRIPKVKIWSAGCACGEEAYSVKVLWEGLRMRCDFMPDLEIWATDINPAYLKRAKDGLYPLSSLREVPQKLRETYLLPHGEGDLYQVALSLNQGIAWKLHNLMFDLGETGFHMIFLRNSILTYLKDELKLKGFRKVIHSLAAGGFLVIGSHEKLPRKSRMLLPVADTTYIFKKIEKPGTHA